MARMNPLAFHELPRMRRTVHKRGTRRAPDPGNTSPPCCSERKKDASGRTRGSGPGRRRQRFSCCAMRCCTSASIHSSPCLQTCISGLPARPRPTGKRSRVPNTATNGTGRLTHTLLIAGFSVFRVVHANGGLARVAGGIGRRRPRTRRWAAHAGRDSSPANARNSPAPSPRHALPCMHASVPGLACASFSSSAPARMEWEK